MLLSKNSTSDILKKLHTFTIVENLTSVLTSLNIYLNADTRQVFDNIDLSQFNVIDCDSYGIAFDLYKKLLTRNDLQKGTIIIYTAITNEFTKNQNVAK